MKKCIILFTSILFIFTASVVAIPTSSPRANPSAEKFSSTTSKAPDKSKYRIELLNSVGVSYVISINHFGDYLESKSEAMGLSYFMSFYKNPKSRLGTIVYFDFDKYIKTEKISFPGGYVIPDYYSSNILIGIGTKFDFSKVRIDLGVGIAASIISYEYSTLLSKTDYVQTGIGYGIYTGLSAFFTEKMALHLGVVGGITIPAPDDDGTASQTYPENSFTGNLFLAPHLTIAYKI